MRGPLGALAQRFAVPTKGEVVVVIGPCPDQEPADTEITAALRHELADGASTRDAAAAVAQRLGVSRSRAYPLAVALRAPPR